MERPTPGSALEPDSHRVSEVQLFREDVVKSIKHPARIGMVTRVGGDSSDSDSSDSDEDNEEDEEGREVSEGSARIVWVDSKETTESVSDICVVDRAFMHGDIVAAASDPLGQTGTVVDVDMSVELELLNKDILKDFDSRRLRRVQCYSLLLILLYTPIITHPFFPLAIPGTSLVMFELFCYCGEDSVRFL